MFFLLAPPPRLSVNLILPADMDCTCDLVCSKEVTGPIDSSLVNDVSDEVELHVKINDPYQIGNKVVHLPSNYASTRHFTGLLQRGIELYDL